VDPFSATRDSPPEGCDVPPDVRMLLDDYAGALIGRDAEALAATLDEDFLFQGMRRDRFIRHVEGSFLRPLITELRVIPTAFVPSGDRATIVAYAETDLGVLPQAADVLPLVGGCGLARRMGSWRLTGDRSPSPIGIYRRFRSVTATLAADDADLFRRLLIAELEMPAVPLVRVIVTDYLKTTPPLEPYRVVQVQLACRLGRQQGWQPVTLPETSWLPVEGGRTLGYPKYLADLISLEGGGDRWLGRCANTRDPALRLEMRFEPDPGRATLVERVSQDRPWAMLRRALPPFRERPWFLLMGGPQANTHPQEALVRGDAVVYGRPRLREVFGRVHLAVTGDEEWVALCHDWGEADGALMEFAGRLNLGHRPVAGPRST
jgi:hypothetical protein